MEKQKNCLHSCMQILQRCATVPYSEDKKVMKEKRNNLVQCFGRHECVCVLYIASVFTSCYHLLIACC
jgi:hypothetical protein